SVGHAQEAGADSSATAAANADEGRQVHFFLAEDLCGHRAQYGILDDRAGSPAGRDKLSSAIVIAFARDERGDDREVLHLLRNGRQVFANLNARGGSRNWLELAGGRLAGLEIPEVDGRGTTAHPQYD